MKKFNLLMFLLLILLSAVLAQAQETKGLTLSNSAIAINVGEIYFLEAASVSEDVSDKNLIWETDNPSVAEVFGGAVKGVSPGLANITVRTADGKYSETCSVNVKSFFLTGSYHFTKTVTKYVNTNVGSNYYFNDGSTVWYNAETLYYDDYMFYYENQLISSLYSAKDKGYISDYDFSGDMIDYINFKKPGTYTLNITYASTRYIDSAGSSACDLYTIHYVITVGGGGWSNYTGLYAEYANENIYIEEGKSFSINTYALPYVSGSGKSNVLIESSNSNVCTVENYAGGLSSYIYAENPGSAVVTVYTDDKSFSKKIYVTVTASEPEIKEIAFVKKLDTSRMDIEFAGMNKITSVSYDMAEVYDADSDPHEFIGISLFPIAARGTDVILRSSNPEVADITDSKWVSEYDTIWISFKKPGKTTLTAKTKDGKHSASCEVTVKGKSVPVTGVELDKTSITVNVGDITALKATVKPTNATNKDVEWKSSNTNIVKVNAKGEFKAYKVGKATVSVRTKDGKFIASCKVTVIDDIVPVSKIKLSKTSGTLTKGKTATLKATISPSNATNQGIIWKSKNPNVATVDQNGKITAKAKGTTYIGAFSKENEKIYATCKVTVKDDIVPVSKIKLSKTSGTLTKGKTATLKATISPSNATNQEIIWISLSPSIAIVDQNGKITAVAKGTAIIRAISAENSKIYADCKVTVK